MTSAFAVFGNPVKHSKSAEIYSFFANELGISSKYSLILALSSNFDKIIYDFFYKNGGLGANITVPFKERACSLCDCLTDRALISNSVNTIKRENDNTLLGDNTDGIGFISDLRRLNWIDSDYKLVSSYSSLCDFLNEERVNILLIGSGGAARGIIPVLLKIKKCYINVVNRTFARAQELVQYYYSIGQQNISCVHIDQLFQQFKLKKYALIVNATSSSMSNAIPKIPSFLINNYTKCYDLFYHDQDTIFIKWCKKQGSNYCADGLGMLIGQAAYSFYLWHNFFPSVDPVVNYFKIKYNMS